MRLPLRRTGRLAGLPSVVRALAFACAAALFIGQAGPALADEPAASTVHIRGEAGSNPPEQGVASSVGRLLYEVEGRDV